MMQRWVFLTIISLLVAGLCLLLYLKFTLPQQDSTVYLKDGSSKVGYVTKKDNYIIITKEGSEEVFPWDEVKSISGPKPLESRTSIFGFWLDKIDFLSSLGVLAALVIFLAGLYQYQQGLLWKREEFLSALLDSFAKSQDVKNAKDMLESLAQYKGDHIKLYPEKEGAAQSPLISNQEVIESLRIPVKDPNEHVITIRQNFDTFLDYFDTLDHYIQLRVVAKQSVYVQLSYWLNLLGRYDKLNDYYRRHIIEYANHFQYEGFIRILGRYNKGHRFWWEIKGKRKSSPNVETGGRSSEAESPLKQETKPQDAEGKRKRK